MPNKKSTVLLTGAGASVDFGIPSTKDITNLVRKEISSSHQNVYPLLEEIELSLKKFLINPGNFNFEDVYNSIVDIHKHFSTPNDPRASDIFRPRIYATHNIDDRFKKYKREEINHLESAYLNGIKNILLGGISTATEKDVLINAVSKLIDKTTLWSFTLNYDTLIDDVIGNHTSGFIGKTDIKCFNPNSIINAINSKETVHCHLHGSLKYDFPPSNPFAIHELKSVADANKSIGGPSGRPSQDGSTIPPRTLVTGLSKTERLLNEPFFSSNFALRYALLNCDRLIIIGYGFSDKHINKVIENFRKHDKKDIIIVGYEKYNDPRTFIDNLPIDGWHDLEPHDSKGLFKLPIVNGFYNIPPIADRTNSHGNIYLWLKGFKSFCLHLNAHELP